MYLGLPQNDYIDPGIFAKEQTYIFRKLWIFAGLRTLLAEPDSFLTRTIGGIPIVIQNFDGLCCTNEIQRGMTPAPDALIPQPPPQQFQAGPAG